MTNITVRTLEIQREDISLPSFNILVITLQVAILATVINIPFAIAISWLVIKKGIRGRLFIDIIVSLPLALPPVTIGYFLLIVLGRNGPIGSVIHTLFGIDLVFTWVAAALASSVVSFPLMTRTIMVAMENVDENIELSARTLGAGIVRTFYTVTLPLSYRGMLAGILLGFIRSLSEFGATIIVAGNIANRTQTLPLAIFERVLLGDNQMALRLVGLSLMLAIVTLFTYNWLSGRTFKINNSTR